MSVLTSLLMFAAEVPAAAPKPGLLPPLMCSVATRSGELAEFKIAPEMVKDSTSFVIQDETKGADQLDQSVGVFVGEVANEWEYLLVRNEFLSAKIRIGKAGVLRNVTIFTTAAWSEVAAGFGFCSEQTIPPTADRKPAKVDFLSQTTWRSGCNFVSPYLPGLIPFTRRTTMSANGPRITLIASNGANYNAADGSRLVFVGGGRQGDVMIAGDRFEDGEGSGAKGVAVSYADPKGKIGSQIIKLNRHAVATGSLYGICSQTVSAAAGGVAIKD